MDSKFVQPEQASIICTSPRTGSSLRVSYEQLNADFETSVRSILEFLGIPYGGALPAQTHRRLGDERSLEWEREYLALEAKDPVVVAPVPPGLFAPC